MAFADDIHKHKPRDIKPQGADSGLDADKVDGLHGHRAWNWADEATFTHVIRVPLGKPVKHAGNPFFEVRSGKFDSHKVAYPNCFRYGNYYYIVYLGAQSGWANPRIGIARCPITSDPTVKTNWTRFDEPIVTPTDIGKTSIGYPNVVVDLPRNKFTMFVKGANYEMCVLSCDLADDPCVAANWSKDADCAIPADCQDPCQGVLRTGNLYWMQYRTDGNILKAMTSDDRSTWTDRAQIVPKGAAGSWDDNLLALSSAFWNLGIYYALYSGHDGSTWAIGLAISFKGFEDFYKLPYNPILEKGSGWEASEVNGPGLIMVEEKFLMFYTGYSSATLLNQIGLATIP
ncbi:MAG: hypothetical protein OEZ35_00075 [Candidatus Bathyarchaeota archaeon]|nr:hypothetical protein [Candidatus Bathyarchaeota archaeon]